MPIASFLLQTSPGTPGAPDFSMFVPVALIVIIIVTRKVVEYIMRRTGRLKDDRPPRSGLTQEEELKRIQTLLDAGAITEEEFEARKKKILGG